MGYLKSRWRQHNLYQKCVLVVALTIIGGIVGLALVEQLSPDYREARRQGFDDFSDMQEASRSGFTDAGQWRANRNAHWAAVAKRDREQQDAEYEARVAGCKSDLKCWAERGLWDAGIYCKDQIAKISEYDHKWTDGWNEAKFSRWTWGDQGKGVVTYIGDKIQFQNEYGAFRIHTYRCDFDPASKRVLAVSAVAGRLD